MALTMAIPSQKPKKPERPRKPAKPKAAQKGLDIERILAEINATTKFFEPPDFDPLRASPQELEEHGLRWLPDPDSDPEGHAFWTRLYSRPLRFEKTMFAISAAAQPRHRAQLRPLGGRDERSLNWSGGYISARQSEMFTEIRGSWQAPVVAPPEAGAIGDFRSSTWIGLDGQRRYLHSSLPQIGTAQFVNVTAAATTFTTQAWWQWWLRDQASAPVYLTSLVINPQDLVSCAIVVVDRFTVRFYIKNESTGVMLTPFERPSPSKNMPTGPSPIRVQITGATAEWVMERPRDPVTRRHYRLPAYGTVAFNDCQALSARAPGVPGRTRSLQGMRRMAMYEIKSPPPRSKIVSRARGPLGPGRLATVFVR
jgi:hypothetical protein